MLEIYGRSIVNAILDTPLYLSLARRYIGIKLLNEKQPLFGSVDVCNVCKLHCKHCYWWLSREEGEDYGFRGIESYNKKVLQAESIACWYSWWRASSTL
jgi:hypothetical protein